MSGINEYRGKIVSILGDSISTFDGFIPKADGKNLKHRTRYPQGNLVTDVEDTWWMRTIMKLGATLGINDSWAGSTVCNRIDGNKGDDGEDTAMASLTRITNLGANGTPDLIFFYGGTNDIGKGVKMGSFAPTTAPTFPNLSIRKWDSFVDAYCEALLRIKHFYPEAEIVALSPSYTKSYYSDQRLTEYVEELMAICRHYGVKLVDIRKSGINVDMLPDGLHPAGQGMECIYKAVIGVLSED